MRCTHRYGRGRPHGFTIIELAITVLIVAILAAVLAPLMQRRVNEAKWVEGRAGAGALATGIRTYCAQTRQGHTGIPAGLSGPDRTVDQHGQWSDNR